MDFFHWLDNLSGVIRGIIIAAVFGFNCITSFLMARHIENVYARTKSPEKAITRLRILNQYAGGALMAVSCFVIVFMSMPFFKGFGHIGIALGLLVYFILIIIMALMMQFMYYKPIKTIRDTSETISEQMKTTLRVLIIMLLPTALILTVILVLPDKVNKLVFSSSFGILLYMLFLIGLNLMMPLFHKTMFKAVPMEDSVLKDRLSSFLISTKLKHTTLYIWPTKKRRIANALVSGFVRKNIFLSDYLIENASPEEIEAILAHEIGHLKKHHLWIRMFSTILPILLIFVTVHIIDYYGKSLLVNVPIIPSIIGFTGLFILYYACIYRYFSRIQERQADAFVLQLNINPDVFISALLKLSKLNHQTMKLNKVDEKFQTHPSYARRIRRIEEKTGIREGTTSYMA